jgi:hypothetical protein
MKIREQAKAARPQPKIGTHLARVLSVVDLGLRPEWVYLGDTKPAEYQLEITYELVNNLMEDGRPFVVSEQMANKVSKDSKSDKITNLTRRLKAFNISVDSPVNEWLGKPCMVTLVANKKNPQYVKIDGQSGVAPIPEGMPVKALTNEAFVFDLETPDVDKFFSFPEFKQTMIKANLEFEGSALQLELDRVS